MSFNNFQIYFQSNSLKSIAWQLEGRQFICSQGDGSLTTWNVKVSNKPLSVVYPHGKDNFLYIFFIIFHRY